MNQTLQLASEAGLVSIKTLRYLLVLADPRAMPTKSEISRATGIKLPNLRAAENSLRKLGLLTKRGSLSVKGLKLAAQMMP